MNIKLNVDVLYNRFLFNYNKKKFRAQSSMQKQRYTDL